ncbi:hypothetical protein WEN_00700 [Mycoplasma wenyonii str. Massachusetts]|uniref:Uncharacterized protein n=1 Tax=Mycoplasma wenyonii (strain Massachusetts) TaxID=1197325 RepID=I6ZIE3_MYCWM|nr:DUF3713 domain-containing protein [Mycoplasma wenyonii]AFN64945.1 hypothetical protein WEN_00700 [Mycoplasma wenyonii str. Massachusetts]
MLTLFTIKKILFFGAIGTGVLGPIIGTSPVIREFTWGGSDISPLKEGIFDLANVNIYDNVSIPAFLKQALIFKEGQEGLVESFAQELAKRWYFSQPSNWTEEQRSNWKELQKKQFEDAWKSINPKNHQRDFWDNYWGSRESMESFWLRHNSYKLVKSFLTDVKKSDFALSESWEWHKSGGNSNSNGELFKRKVFASDEELEKPDSWKKIGFFPSKSREHFKDEKWKKFIQGKFDFINWSYKKWFDRTLPMYFWKISWYYDKNATNSEIEKEYSKKHLKEHFPSKANYSFPVFSKKTIEKFKSFIKNVSESNAESSGSSSVGQEKLELEKYYIDNWKGDQSSPATLLEILNSFEGATPEYASVASYLVNKVLSGNSTAGAGDRVGQNDSQINKLEGQTIKTKNGDLNDPISIFFDENGGTGKNNNTNISFDSEILTKKTESKKHKYVHDVRETDAGWIFFRDADGAHALALDGHRYLERKSGTSEQNEDAKNKLFNWFNFRNLQSSETRRNWSSGKKFLNLSETDNWFSKFSDYLNTNFDKLLAEYFVRDNNGNKELFELLKEEDKSYFNKYKDVLTKIFGLWSTNEWNSKIFGLRQKIIGRYSSIDWKKEGYGNSNIKVVTKQGLSSPFPFATDFSDSKKERFKSQENVFNEFLKPKEQATQSVVAVKVSDPVEAESPNPQDSATAKKFIEYHKSIQELLDGNKIDLKIRSKGFDFQSSQRLFVNDSIFDYLQDKLFANKDLLNYQVKEGKLLNSGFFRGNSLLKDKKDNHQNETNLPWLAPLNVEKNLSEFLQVPPKLTQANAQQPATGAQNNGCWKCESFQSGKNEETNKSSLESLLNKLLKIYFFKNYLKTVKEDYFDFLSDFPSGQRKNGAGVEQQQESQVQLTNTTKFDFLTDELFEKWRKSYLSDIKERNNFLDFLITLSYLSKKNFEGLREAMKVELVSSTDYHYLLFEATSNKTTEGEQNKKPIHPFLGKKNGEAEDSSEQNFFESREKARQHIRENWRTVGKLSLSNPPTIPQTTGETKDAIYKQLITEKPSLPSKTDKNNLFNFKDLKGLIDRIKNISSPSDFDKLVTLISKVHTKVIPDFYRGDKLFTKEKKEKKIYLEEKKKLLVYQLLHTDQGPFYSSSEIEKENEILSKDIDKIAQEAKLSENSGTTAVAVQTTSGGSGGTEKKHLNSKYFNREKGTTKDGGYFIQVSSKDFEDESSTCEFFNLLPIELLAEFLALEADKPLNKDKAQKSFFDGTSRVKARDMKFKSHVDSKHVE